MTEVDSLIVRIYEAGIDPQQLDTVAAEICAAVGADIMFSQIRKPSGEPGASFVRHGVSEMVLVDYGVHYWRDNPITPPMLQAPLDILHDLYNEIVPRGEIENTEMYNDWALPMGLLEAQGWRGSVAPGHVLAVTVGRSSHRRWSDAELRCLTRVAPYLSNAARLRHLLADAQEEISSLRTLIDSLRCAVFLLDERRHVVAANSVACALLRDGGMLRYDGGRLIGAQRASDRELQSAIQNCMRGTVGMPVRLQARGVASPLAFVLPRSGRHDDPEAGAIVLVSSANPGGAQTENWLRVGYGLTKAEASVAVRVAAGDDLREIGESRGVAIGTVRNQLKRAMQKLGVHRRAQLVNAVRAVAGPFPIAVGEQG